MYAIIAIMTVLLVIAGHYLVVITGLIAIAATIFSEKAVRSNILKLGIISFIIAFLVAFIAGNFYYDTRPFVVNHIEPLIPHKPDNGFPSDHTLIGMVTATTIFVYKHKLGILLGVLGILVGIVRIIALLHYPIDIVGSTIIAIVATCCAWMILKKSGKRFGHSP